MLNNQRLWRVQATHAREQTQNTCTRVLIDSWQPPTSLVAQKKNKQNELKAKKSLNVGKSKRVCSCLLEHCERPLHCTHARNGTGMFQNVSPSQLRLRLQATVTSSHQRRVTSLSNDLDTTNLTLTPLSVWPWERASEHVACVWRAVRCLVVVYVKLEPVKQTKKNTPSLELLWNHTKKWW